MVFRRLAVLLILLVPALPAVPGARVPDSAAEITLSFAPIVKRAAPAVVNIYATRVVAQRTSPFADDPFFRDFFGAFDRSAPRVQNALGSGVIVRSDGIVVSNHHVVGDASEIRVVLADRREFAATVLMSDPNADLAVLRLEGAKDLPALDFADSESAEVGDLVLAIGNPFGVGQTVTSGIVSGLARSSGGEGRGAGYFIQTDAPINPGNSGGALIDMEGRLLGINTSILTRSGESNGIGFAIPASLVRQFVAQAEDGRTTFLAPWSGVSVQPIDASVAGAVGLDAPRGVIVTAMHPESPLAAAGIGVGDIILGVDGLPVNSAAELSVRLAARGVGSEARITYRRDHEEAEATVALVPAPEGDPPIRISSRTIFDGVEAAVLSPRLIDDLGLPLDATGVVVTGLDGAARRTGLEPGDVIRGVNGSTVGTPDDFARAVTAQSPVWDIEIVRGGRALRLRLRG